jgi:hypothetical protein
MWGNPDAPTEEDRAAAAMLALTVVGPSWFCQRCLQSDPGLHFIASDVFGRPAVYCVQVPSYSVVNSSGGGGDRKHSGRPWGCRSVGSWIDPDARAAYVYGQPLPAEEVINREWCSRCQSAAANVVDNAAAQGESATDWDEERTRRDVRVLMRQLAEHVR